MNHRVIMRVLVLSVFLVDARRMIVDIGAGGALVTRSIT